jgi:hypothetical protein
MNKTAVAETKKCRYTGVLCMHEFCKECPVWLDFEQRQLSKDAD